MAVRAPRFPVPVAAAIGAGAWGPVQELRACDELRLVTTPRHATVLLVAGDVPAEHRQALDRVHDQLPHPRAVVSWTAGQDSSSVLGAAVTGDADAVVAAVVEAHHRVTTDPSSSVPDRRPDVEPNEWRGIGPFGQGGEGMMGGTPYGRAMAMTGDDRDGLALDQLHLTLGPFLDPLPPGMIMAVTLQGEVLQEVELRPPPVDGAPFRDDLGADDTSAPARRGLRWLAHALHVHGLDADAARAARLAGRCRPGVDLIPPYRALRRRLRWTGLRWSLRGVGPIDGAGDAAGRWDARLDQIDAGLAGDPVGGALPSAVAWGALPHVLEGLTLTDAVTTLVSLDLAAQPATRGSPR